MPTFGERIRDIRKESGLSQKDLSAQAGMTREVLAKIETGVRDDLRVSEVVKLSAALKVAPHDLDPRLADPVKPPMTARQWEQVRLSAKRLGELMSGGA